MWKKALVASAALAIAGTTLVQAQRFGGDGTDATRGDGPGPMRGIGRMQFSADDFAAFTDARVAAIKAGLRLTPDQENNWPAFENAYRNFAKLRLDRRLAMRDRAQQPPSTDMMDRLQRRADSIGRSADAYKQLAATATPLYRSLDDGQKQRFTVLARLMQPRMGRGFRGRRGNGPLQMEPGNMQRDGGGPRQFQRGSLDEPGLAEGSGVERIHYRSPGPDFQ
jgi:zinc resistance-associated protein